MTGSVFLLQRVCCLHSSQHCTQETKSHSLARYFPKDWYCMFQSEPAELTLLVAIKKSLDFYLCLDRLGFLITRSTSLETKVRIHMLTHYGYREHRIPTEGGDWRL